MSSNALVTWNNSILIYDGVVEIHHNELIRTSDQYDGVQWCAMNYLHFEGFLETIDLKHPEVCGNIFRVDDIQIFDNSGKRITREQLI